MPEPDDKAPWIEVDMARPQTFDKVALKELFGQVKGFELQALIDGDWSTFYKGGALDDYSFICLNRLGRNGCVC